MSYKTYNEYKDSGVKWIGKIPIEWNTIKAKFCFNISHGHYFKSNDFVDEGINLVRIGNLVDGTIELDNCVKLPLEYYQLFKEYIINSNDLLIALTGATIGKIAHVPKTSKLMLLNYRVGKINCDNPNYYKYLLSAHFIQTQIRLISDGSAQDNIGNKDFDELIILDIDNNTKKAITNYLDKKTYEIDYNISKNKELISLLEEKKVALVNQCVTKGLDSNVTMKYSGSDWIGEIPSHWNTLKSSLLFKRVNIISTTGTEDLLSVSEYYGVKPKKESISEGEFLSRAESLVGYKKCFKNDLVMNIMLAWKKGLGISQYDGIVSPAYEIFKTNLSKAFPRFFDYLWASAKTNFFIFNFL